MLVRSSGLYNEERAFLSSTRAHLWSSLWFLLHPFLIEMQLTPGFSRSGKLFLMAPGSLCRWVEGKQAAISCSPVVSDWAFSPSHVIRILAVAFTFQGSSFPNCEVRIQNCVSGGYCDVEVVFVIAYRSRSIIILIYNSSGLEWKKSFRLCFQPQ